MFSGLNVDGWFQGRQSGIHRIFRQPCCKEKVSTNRLATTEITLEENLCESYPALGVITTGSSEPAADWVP
jgi:hypothetical protein